MSAILYVIAVAEVAVIYAIAVLGLNIQWGKTGLVNYGLYGVFAVGAYSHALLVLHGTPIPLAFLVSAVFSAIYIVAIGFITISLKPDYFFAASIGIAEITQRFILNESWLTNGPDGLSGIPRLFSSEIHYLIFLLIVLFASYVFLEVLVKSPFGSLLKAIREDEVAAESLGKNVFRFKMFSLFIGSLFIGGAGALFAHYMTYISPDMFKISIMFYIFTSLVLGGLGRNIGGILGAFTIMGFLEATRFLKDYLPIIPSVQWLYMRPTIVGVLFILIIMFKPEGLLREKKRVYK